MLNIRFEQKLHHRMIANARERDRTESVNNAFNRLRRLLPTIPSNRKLSKIEILRLATSYIRHLNNICQAIKWFGLYILYNNINDQS
ncbi:hypothetical protein BLA29_002953 [Euroglyphus maynei]|uniref:BHLH domain-containing protein n=1 Tax=Euroglyphus maynei TaxID=6958 RepID=A0A1Y3BFF7_EURMA|nr:hypothetical protein BLA29_002953 [Euroglyphus maynei]